MISGKVSDVEDRYRKALDAAGAFACGRAMPVFVFAPLGGGRPSAGGAAGAVPAALHFSADGTVLLTEALILDRLGVVSMPAIVSAKSLVFLGSAGSETKSAADAEADTKKEDANVRDKYMVTLLSLTEGAAGVWVAEISYDDKTYNVDPDELGPPPKAAAIAKPQQITTLPEFNWEDELHFTTRCAAEYALVNANIMTFDAVASVDVELVGGKDKSPYDLRVRVTKDFKVGKLYLVPYLGFAPRVLHAATDADELRKYDAAAKNVVGTSLIPRALVEVQAVEVATPRATTGQPPAKRRKYIKPENFFAVSPLFFAKPPRTADVLRNFPPFWAVTKTGESKKVNMVVEAVPFETIPAQPKGVAMPSPTKKSLFTVTVHCMRNTRALKAGELLCISLMDEMGVEGEESSGAEDDA